MARAYDDEEVRRESPRYGAQHREQWLVAHGPHQDVEAYEQDEDIHHYGGQSQLIHAAHRVESGARAVRRRHLVGGHAAEQGIGPACLFAGALMILCQLMSAAYGSSVVGTGEDQSVADGRQEVNKADDDKQHYSCCVGPNLRENAFHILTFNFQRSTFNFSNICSFHFCTAPQLALLCRQPAQG